MSVLLALLFLQSASTASAEELKQAPAVTEFESTNVIIGACERYIPIDTLVELNAVVARATPEIQAQVARLREEGRQLARRERMDHRICSALLRHAFKR